MFLLVIVHLSFEDLDTLSYQTPTEAMQPG